MKTTSAEQARAMASEILLGIAASIWPEVEREEHGSTMLGHWYALRYAASWYRTNTAGPLPDHETAEMAEALDAVHAWAHPGSIMVPRAHRCDCAVARECIRLAMNLAVTNMGARYAHAV